MLVHLRESVPSDHAKLAYFDCTSTYGLGVADGILALSGGIAAGAALSQSKQEYADKNNGASRNVAAGAASRSAGLSAAPRYTASFKRRVVIARRTRSRPGSSGASPSTPPPPPFPPPRAVAAAAHADAAAATTTPGGAVSGCSRAGAPARHRAVGHGSSAVQIHADLSDGRFPRGGSNHASGWSACRHGLPRPRRRRTGRVWVPAGNTGSASTSSTSPPAGHRVGGFATARPGAARKPAPWAPAPPPSARAWSRSATAPTPALRRRRPTLEPTAVLPALLDARRAGLCRRHTECG